MRLQSLFWGNACQAADRSNFYRVQHQKNKWSWPFIWPRKVRVRRPYYRMAGWQPRASWSLLPKAHWAFAVTWRSAFVRMRWFSKPGLEKSAAWFGGMSGFFQLRRAARNLRRTREFQAKNQMICTTPIDARSKMKDGSNMFQICFFLPQFSVDFAASCIELQSYCGGFGRMATRWFGRKTCIHWAAPTGSQQTAISANPESGLSGLLPWTGGGIYGWDFSGFWNVSAGFGFSNHW